MHCHCWRQTAVLEGIVILFSTALLHVLKCFLDLPEFEELHTLYAKTQTKVLGTLDLECEL